ncbi:hypothetical protein Tdes44962_MAKER04891 [Teratosphaeria destructans]|uniref:Uncharacterized protein n=1 Tax=Teratosphaeria destructans TaxID=418781 RepID=A0A9W7VZC1_9PEZI|nr:hypothetical protein Tdes44962_MAKER04891 [Teratosphaeria destructans]
MTRDEQRPQHTSKSMGHISTSQSVSVAPSQPLMSPKSRSGFRALFGSSSPKITRQLKQHQDQINDLEDRLSSLENVYTKDIEVLKYIEDQRMQAEEIKRKQFRHARENIRQQAWVDPKLRRYVELMGLDNFTTMTLVHY